MTSFPLSPSRRISLTAFEAHLVPLVAAGHLLLGGVDGAVTLGALGSFDHFEWHLHALKESTSSSVELKISRARALWSSRQWRLFSLRMYTFVQGGP